MNAYEENPNQQPAHILWVELSTRITSHSLHYRSGNEEKAAKSVHYLFDKTRELMADHPEAKQFNKLALGFLNNVLRSYTARWHRWMTADKQQSNNQTKSILIFKDEQVRRLFRAELIDLKGKVSIYEQVFKSLSEENKISEDLQKAVDGLSTGIGQANLGCDIEVAKLSHINNIDKEYSEILNRRKEFNPQLAQNELINATGLALSGGGIRSATFCLGIVQTLAKKDLFHQFDYLSTVSGGGYLGTFLSSILADEGQLDKDKTSKNIIDGVLKIPQISRESTAIRHLRNSSKYLGTGGIEWMAGLMVFGILMNFLLLLPLPMFMATIVYLLIDVGFWGFPKDAQAIWFGLFPSIAGYILSGLLALLIIVGFILPCIQSFTQGKHQSTLRDCWEKITLYLALASIAGLGIYFLPLIFQSYACFQAKLHSAWQIIITGTVPFLLAYGTKLLEAWKRTQKFILKLFVLSGPVFFLTIFLTIGNYLGIGEITKIDHHNTAITIAVAAFVLWMWSWWLVNINTTSPHRYYRNRLCECYLIKRKKQNEIEARTDMSLSELSQGRQSAPYHLINTTVNLTTSQNPELRGRNGDFFLISKHICGSPTTDYYPTEKVVRKNPHLDLGSAMAISGAAASTGMGWQTMTSYRFLMGLLNIRLGYWLLNPNPKEKIRYQFLEGPGPAYLYKEIFGLMKETDRYLNLSDGGHIENLAAYELLRRKCKFIVCVDGGQEYGMECADLIRLQRYAEIDLGIRMEYEFSDLLLNESRLSKAHAVLVKIIYSSPEQDTIKPDWSKAELGWMLYIKLAMTGVEPAYVSDYRRENPTFPHQTTGDQFFDEAQFEAYRMLGECAAESLFRSEIMGSSAPSDLQSWFQKLANNLLPDNDPVFN